MVKDSLYFLNTPELKNVAYLCRNILLFRFLAREMVLRLYVPHTSYKDIAYMYFVRITQCCVKIPKKLARLSSNQLSCIYFVDINECASHPCDVNANCTNTIGSHMCKCRTGYEGNGKRCRGKLGSFNINHRMHIYLW